MAAPVDIRKVRQARFTYAKAFGRNRYIVSTKKLGCIGVIWYMGTQGAHSWQGQTTIGRKGWDCEGKSKFEISEKLEAAYNKLMEGK